MVAGRVCSQSSANIKCQALVKPPDYIRLQWWLNPSFESNISDWNLKKEKMERTSDYNFSIPNTFFSKNIWQNNFLDLFINEPEGPKGLISYRLVKAGCRGPQQECSSISPVAMPLITPEMCFPTIKPVSIPPPMGLCPKTYNSRRPQTRCIQQLLCPHCKWSERSNFLFLLIWWVSWYLILRHKTKLNWSFFLYSLAVQKGFYRQYSYR